jgi:hypothetical protein
MTFVWLRWGKVDGRVLRAKGMDGKAPAARVPDSLYGDATLETRLWALDYIARNRDMLDLMARL